MKIYESLSLNKITESESEYGKALHDALFYGQGYLMFCINGGMHHIPFEEINKAEISDPCLKNLPQIPHCPVSDVIRKPE